MTPVVLADNEGAVTIDGGATNSGGSVSIRVSKRDRSQDWFWTPAWQEGEREADEDVAAGRLRRYDDVESFLADLA